MTQHAVQPELGAREFLDALAADIAAHPTLQHSFLQRLRSEKLTRRQLAAFATQHYLYSCRFTQNLAALVSNTPHEDVRGVLIENMYEEIGEPSLMRDRAHLLLLEAGHVTGAELGRAFQRLEGREGDIVQVLLDDGTISRDQVAEVVVRTRRQLRDLTHPALLRRFLAALGITPAQLTNARPLQATVSFNEVYADLCRNGNWLMALGALGPGTECIVPALYQSVLDGIRNSAAVDRPDYVFWTLHVHCDEGHGADMVNALLPHATTRDAHRRIADGAHRVLDARGAWFDQLESHVFSQDNEGVL